MSLWGWDFCLKEKQAVGRVARKVGGSKKTRTRVAHLLFLHAVLAFFLFFSTFVRAEPPVQKNQKAKCRLGQILPFSVIFLAL
jgi:hypothetical protein